MALGTATGRIGCLFAGCCAGTASDLPWAVGGRHPAPLYESIGALAVLALVLAVRRRRRVPGEAFLAFGEFLRANHAPKGGLTVHQWIAAASVALCAALFLARRRLFLVPSL
jgi:phosphatidylglycerol:prolipoprotein diacylglycerol transferase